MDRELRRGLQRIARQPPLNLPERSRCLVTVARFEMDLNLKNETSDLRYRASVTSSSGVEKFFRLPTSNRESRQQVANASRLSCGGEPHSEWVEVNLVRSTGW